MSVKVLSKSKTENRSDSNLIKIFYIMGWGNTALLVLDLIIILIGGITTLNLVFMYVSFLFTAFNFGTGSLIESNPSRRNTTIKTYLISSLSIGIIAILVLSAYQWSWISSPNFFKKFLRKLFNYGGTQKSKRNSR